MTTPDAQPAPVPDVQAPERRLHPWSWLFVLLLHLKQFVVPLVAAFFFGGDRNELWPMLGVGVLALASLAQYFSYRYRVGADAIRIRSGWLQRSRREIPFARIHNVAVQQSLLHRMFGVAELRLESAGGQKPEAQMRVLRLEDALALERLIRHRGAGLADGADEAPSGRTLLDLPTAEVLRLGLVSNRGLLLLGGAAAAVSQFSPRLLPNLFESWGEALFGWAGSHHFGWREYAFAAVSLALAFVVLLRLLSIAAALLQYHGFRLSEHGRRLTVERGLLARLRTSAPRRRLQAWTLHESLLHRLLGRRSLQVDSAAGAQAGEHAQRTLRELAPIATPQACDALVTHLLPPGAGWTTLEWQPFEARAWWRLVLPGLPVAMLVGALAGWRFGAWGLLVLAWLPWRAWRARRWLRHAAWAENATLVAVREGGWSRHWRFAEIDKLQALQLSRSPLDRRCGTATLWLDTAGASPLAPPLRIRFLPEATARALHARLARTLARRPLRW